MNFISVNGLTESLPRLPRSCEAESAVNSRLQCAVVGTRSPLCLSAVTAGWRKRGVGGGGDPSLRLGGGCFGIHPDPPPLAGLTVERCAASPVCHSNKCVF